MMIYMNGQSGVGALTGAGAPRPARLPLWLADQIEEHMLDGEFLVDAQLPTETALSESYGVSRQVVREAARLLEDRGLVNIRPGRGMTVAAPDVETIVRRYRSLLRRDRASFVAPDAAAPDDRGRHDRARGAEPHRGGRRAACARCSRRRASTSTTTSACLEADLAFHLAVAHATQNPFVLTFVQPINMVLRDVYREPIGYLATQENTLREHGAIADAIAGGDADAARAAAALHLSRVVEDAAKLVG